MSSTNVYKERVSEQQLSQSGITPETISSALDADFAAHVDATFGTASSPRGRVTKGIITAIEKAEFVIIDIGMKAEGRVSIREFADAEGVLPELKVGDTVDVFVDNLDDRNGEAQLSREKARREEVLTTLEGAYNKSEKVKGTIFGKVKGGFMVDVQGILGFMPGSQLDSKPITDLASFMNVPMELMIVKLDRKKNNLIVSRRSATEGTPGVSRENMLADMHEGKVVMGTVKNITEYGAFIDLGGIDGLLHITDIAWHRISHPSEYLKVGQSLQMKVVRFDQNTKRVSLGLKQLNDDPWKSVDAGYPIGAKVKGKITNVTDYGAFVELAPGVEGLIHVSEMSWTRKAVSPSKIVAVGQVMDVQVLEIDREKRRISLGLKQTQDNPWQSFASSHKEGDVVKGTIRSITDFGVFLGLNDDIDGLIHVSDLAWDKSGEQALAEYKKGMTVEAKILSIDPEKERIALGVKQLSTDTFGSFSKGHKKGQVVKATVSDIDDDGITVSVDGVETHIKKRDLAADREGQEPKKFKKGQEVEAKITAISEKDRKLTLSIRAMQVDEEREAVATYAGGDAGAASLGDVLSGALKKAGKKPADEAETEDKPAKKSKKKTDE